MSALPADGLRGLVAETIREVVAELVGASVREALADGVAAPAPTATPLTPAAPTVTPLTAPAPVAPAAAPVRRVNGHARSETVRVRDDADLDAFARHLLELFENPKNRQDLRAGRIRFTLARAQSGVAGAAVRRIEHGAVTERQVKEAAEAQVSIVLGPRAVLTPLGRERARALGVSVEKER